MKFMLRAVIVLVATGLLACASTPTPEPAPAPAAATASAATPCDSAPALEPALDGRCPIDVGAEEEDPFAKSPVTP